MTTQNTIERAILIETRNEVGNCPHCGSNIKDRKVSLYKELVNALYRVYCYCGEHGIHEFEMKNIKDMLGKNEYARFGDLVRFGGLVYRPKIDGDKRKALYGINMARAKEFFAGSRTIPVQIVLNQITNEIVSQTECHYHEFPSLLAFIKEHGLYDFEKNILVDPIIPEVIKNKKTIKRPVIRKIDGRMVAVFEE